MKKIYYVVISLFFLGIIIFMGIVPPPSSLDGRALGEALAIPLLFVFAFFFYLWRKKGKITKK